MPVLKRRLSVPTLNKASTNLSYTNEKRHKPASNNNNLSHKLALEPSISLSSSRIVDGFEELGIEECDLKGFFVPTYLERGEEKKNYCCLAENCWKSTTRVYEWGRHIKTYRRRGRGHEALYDMLFKDTCPHCYTEFEAYISTKVDPGRDYYIRHLKEKHKELFKSYLHERLPLFGMIPITSTDGSVTLDIATAVQAFPFDCPSLFGVDGSTEKTRPSHLAASRNSKDYVDPATQWSGLDPVVTLDVATAVQAFPFDCPSSLGNLTMDNGFLTTDLNTTEVPTLAKALPFDCPSSLGNSITDNDFLTTDPTDHHTTEVATLQVFAFDCGNSVLDYDSQSLPACGSRQLNHFWHQPGC